MVVFALAGANHSPSFEAFRCSRLVGGAVEPIPPPRWQLAMFGVSC